MNYRRGNAMALLKNAWILKGQISALSQGIANTLVLTPKSALPSALNNVAFFATQNELVMPKKPLTAFFLFRQDNVDTVKRQYPNKKMTEQMSLISEMWRNLTEEQREVYKNKYNDAMEGYKQKIEKMENDPKLGPQLAQLREEKKVKMAERAYQKVKIERRNFLKELGKPKKSAVSAYSIFSQEVFKSIHQKGTPVTATTKIISEKWKNLTDAQKEPYAAKYEKAKEAHDAAMLAWKEKLDDENADAIKGLNNKMTRKRQLKSRSTEVEE